MAIYDRLPGETPKAFEAFCAYRDLGPTRSLQKAADGLDKSMKLLGRWSSQHNWQERVAAWDGDQDMLRQEEAISSKRVEYRRNLAEYQKNNLAVGRAAFKASATIAKQILEFVEKTNSIDSWDDANKASNIIKGLTGLSDLWAKALAVDRLLQKLEWDDD
jgi:hypothetical protein